MDYTIFNYTINVNSAVIGAVICFLVVMVLFGIKSIVGRFKSHRKASKKIDVIRLDLKKANNLLVQSNIILNDLYKYFGDLQEKINNKKRRDE